jgi:1-acyl-sn-glycerol-3-phosphate acyltransferase
MIFITPVLSSNETSKNTLFIRELNKTVKSVEASADHRIKISYFGSVAVAVSNAERLKKDIRLTLTITLILLALIINFSIRKKKLFPFIFFPAIFGGLIAMAVLYLFQGKISVISLSIGTVILAITVDYALHITTHYKHKHSVIDTIKDVSFPIIVCGFATAFEFLTLIFVSSESLNELGFLAAISVITAAFFTMVVIPHILDVTRSASDETEMKNILEKVLDKVTNYHFDRNRLLIGFMVLVTLTSVFYIRKVGFETDMMKMSYVTSELNQAEEMLNKINGYKLQSVYLVAYGKNLEDALESNERILERAKNLKNEGRIRRVNSPGALLLSDSLQMLKIRQWNDFWHANKKEALLESFEKESIETGFRPGSFSTFHKLITSTYAVADTALSSQLSRLFFVDNITESRDLATVITVLKVDQASKEQVVESFTGMPNTIVIDRRSILSNIVNTLGHDFNFIANVSMLLILAVLIFAFGRIELGVITFIPIFLSWIWTLGFMGFFGIKFNIFNIIISSFITGLGIDYSIYIMQGLVQGYKTENRNLLSYKTCILISVMISLSGTGVLILAKHPALNSIALISIVGLLSIVLISYTFEIIAFQWLVLKRGKNRRLPVTFTDLFTTLVVFSIFIIGSLLLNLIFFVIILLPVSVMRKKLIMHTCMAFSCKVPVYAMVHIRKNLLNPSGEDFSKPAMILSNHQSHIDLLLLLMLHPKIIVLTNRWVWNNPIYALVIRFLDYYPVMEGYENIIEKLKNRVDEGYSVLVFPEGSRSPDSNIRRFHKGAFLLAEKLGLDLLPVMIHGAGDCMNKRENHLRGGSVTLKIFPRIQVGSKEYGSDYHERTKTMLAFYRREYNNMKEELETPSYFRGKLIRNYIYKGPFLEWYTRIKLSLENNYELYDRYVPRDARVVDIGCGYGFISYMLAFVSDKREILGIDYDADKIELARHCISGNGQLQFVEADALSYPFQQADVFILSDVLHYLPADDQQVLLERCASRLNPGGVIIIRDADLDLKRRHMGTRYTEFFSTRLGFNKLQGNRLCFFSGDKIRQFAEKHSMQLETIDVAKLTSNMFYVLKKSIN